MKRQSRKIKKRNEINVNTFDGQFFIEISPHSETNKEGWEYTNNIEMKLHMSISQIDFANMNKLGGDSLIFRSDKNAEEIQSICYESCHLKDSLSKDNSEKPLFDNLEIFFKHGDGCSNKSWYKTFQEIINERSQYRDFKLLNSRPLGVLRGTQKGKLEFDSGVDASDEKGNSEKKNSAYGKLTNLEKPEVFECSQCGKRSNTRGNLKIHMATHGDELLYLCEKCGKSFKHKYGLLQHMNVHSDMIYPCHLCPKKFTNSQNLSRHDPGVTRQMLHVKRVDKRKEKKKHTCSICQKVLSRKCLLMEHMNGHNNLRPYQCSQCPLAFAGRANLLRHKKIHERKGA